MPDETQAPQTNDVNETTLPPVKETGAVAEMADKAGVQAEVAQKIGEARNVLIALSANPSVDEMAAAIGLSLYLDRLGKRATAIYSGATPNALAFLKPEETFEESVDALQDFVIALNKEKADHLRYKLDGDYVKIFITPYQTRIAEEDLEFSYGDFNVDLVLALDVANGVDLDSALREHGRIMHDAVIINITTGNPGKLGEIEWSDKSASSVSEMIAKLLYNVNSKIQIEKEEATAFLTGIVAATDRFSTAGTSPETMVLASKLMKSGANQQLISKNITSDVDNEMFGIPGFGTMGVKKESDPSKLDIQHGNEEVVEKPEGVEATVTEKESTLLDDLKAAEASLAAAGAETVPENKQGPVRVEELDGATEPSLEPELPPVVSESNSTVVPEAAPSVSSVPADEGFVTDKPEKVLTPITEPEMLAGDTSGFTADDSNRYGKMLEEALGAINEAPAAPVSSSPVSDFAGGNPAASFAPEVPSNPEINGVPEINYMPMPGDQVLPPPPVPPIDMSEPAQPQPMTDVAMPSLDPVAVEPITPAMPEVEPTPEPLGKQPAMQDQVYAPQASDPGAFKIPGM